MQRKSTSAREADSGPAEIANRRGQRRFDLDTRKTGQGLWPWPAAISVELPGIEPALEIALNRHNAKLHDVKARQTT
jgi:hypothetical protein